MYLHGNLSFLYKENDIIFLRTQIKFSLHFYYTYFLFTIQVLYYYNFLTNVWILIFINIFIQNLTVSKLIYSLLLFFKAFHNSSGFIFCNLRYPNPSRRLSNPQIPLNSQYSQEFICLYSYGLIGIFPEGISFSKLRCFF